MTFVLALVSAAIGILLSLMNVALSQSIKSGTGEKFFRETRAGRQIARALGIELSLTGPEALFKELSVASQKMDEVVKQIQEYTQGRELAVAKLESQLGVLSQQEQEMKERIQGLQNVPLVAAEYFAQLVNKGEKRSALRDYVLFLMGVVVTSGVEVVLRKMGWV
ncbi:MAG TPA: hypothetical protein VFF64_16975 [Candidatus Eremiobacteraceae bacterium]|nr:hypothetical protein [Candidatus Eremiobacteraceae bacterium]